MAVSASVGSQPWIRSVETRQNRLEEKTRNLEYEVNRRAVPDKTVFTDGTPYVGRPSSNNVIYPANSSVYHTNTTGLIEVTVSATLRTSDFAGAGVGVFFDELSPTFLNGAPKYGVSYRASSGESVTGASYTSVFSVRPGTREIGLYYATDTTAMAGSISVIELATIIVRSV